MAFYTCPRGMGGSDARSSPFEGPVGVHICRCSASRALIRPTAPAGPVRGMMSLVSESPPQPLYVLNAAAPIRICDNGGWTDTWFAGHGKVFNIGVHPCVEVRVKVHPRHAQSARIMLEARNYGLRYAFEPGDLPGRHPLAEAAIDHIGLPDDVSLDISLHSEAPAGGSTGTSAAMTVALVGALDWLTPGRLTPHQIAATAHRLEFDRLRMQSGIQDQLCAAYGGINYIEVSDYPRASVSQLSVTEDVWRDLERRLVLIFLGRAHVSSDVHERVIACLEGEGDPRLEELRRAAESARDAVNAADLPALGRAMTQNTDVQGRLDAGVVSKEAQTVFEVAAAHGALGWKLNGAGGEGGSVTILCGPDMGAKRKLLDAIGEAGGRFRVIPTQLSRHGLRVWRT